MGGWGSGRRHTGKSLTTDCRSLDVRRLHRDGLLTPGLVYGWNWTLSGETLASIQVRTADDRLTLSYRFRSGGGEWRPMEYPVRLARTPCTYGGVRSWFVCGCGARVALLYRGASGVFVCRRCNQLAYACQRESAGDRATRRADKIRERLGWEPGILNGPERKPDRMHTRTYARLKAQHDACVRVSLAWMVDRLRLLERLGVRDRGLYDLLGEVPVER
jgi:hypothetical protein